MNVKRLLNLMAKAVLDAGVKALSYREIQLHHKANVQALGKFTFRQENL